MLFCQHAFSIPSEQSLCNLAHGSGWHFLQTIYFKGAQKYFMSASHARMQACRRTAKKLATAIFTNSLQLVSCTCCLSLALTIYLHLLASTCVCMSCLSASRHTCMMNVVTCGCKDPPRVCLMAAIPGFQSVSAEASIMQTMCELNFLFTTRAFSH